MKYANAGLSTAVSTAASFASRGELVEQISVYCIQAVYTGAPSGSLVLQVSNDMVPLNQTPGADPASNVVNWTNLPNSSTTVSAAGSTVWNMPSEGYRWVRLSWTGSGTGTLSAQFSGKGG